MNREDDTQDPSVEWYRLLVENAEDFAFLCDSERKPVYVSPAFCRTTGWTCEDVQTGRWKDWLHPDERAAVMRTREANERGEMTRFEHRIRCRNGDWIWVEDRCNPLPSSQGGVAWFVVWMRNITAFKAAEARHDDVQAQLLQAQKMEAVGRLAGGMAHDFNNVLQAITATTELMLRDITPGAPWYDDLSEIVKAAKRSSDMTRQLLAFAAKQTIAPKVFDLNQAITGMVVMLKRLIGENIELVWSPTAALWPIKMDTSQLDQILANLVVNSRDAISGTGQIVVKTTCANFDEAYCQAHPGAQLGEYVVLAVSDNGCGMDETTQRRLFEPFFTTKENGRGPGLGLATVYGIVAQNHGFIEFESRLGVGTTFRICLPRSRETIETEATRVERTAAETHEKTVLLVEDEESLLRLGRRLLESLGYTVLCADNPQTALLLASEYKREIHLLLTDVVMPEMDGRQLQEKLTESRPEMKSLFMSGYHADTIAHCGVLDQGIDFIQKPFSRAALGAKLRELFAAPQAS
jgi:PAS domain S-box-containing protein